MRVCAALLTELIGAAKPTPALAFGSLVLAVNEGGDLRYVGNVGTGFDSKEIERLLALLRPLERKDPPFRVVPKMPRVRKGDVVWTEPNAMPA